jgi:hypothetical protein
MVANLNPVKVQIKFILSDKYNTKFYFQISKEIEYSVGGGGLKRSKTAYSRW